MDFEEASHLWAKKQLGNRIATIRFVSFDVKSYTGCETCGPETYVEACIAFTCPDGSRGHEYLEFTGIGEILQGIFEVSEPVGGEDGEG